MKRKKIMNKLVYVFVLFLGVSMFMASCKNSTQSVGSANDSDTIVVDSLDTLQVDTLDTLNADSTVCPF